MQVRQPQVPFGQILVVSKKNPTVPGSLMGRLGQALGEPAEYREAVELDRAILKQLPNAIIAPAGDNRNARIVIDGETDRKTFLDRVFLAQRRNGWDAHHGDDGHPGNRNLPLGVKLDSDHPYYTNHRLVAIEMMLNAGDAVKRLDISDAAWQQIKPE